MLQGLGIVGCVLLGLTGCGGSSGERSGSTPRVSRLTLQFALPDRVSAGQQVGALSSAQVRQIRPGDPGFVERLEIRIQAQGRDLIPVQRITPLSPAEQETGIVTREIDVPTDTTLQAFQILVFALNPSGVEIFHGETSVESTKAEATVKLMRSTPPSCSTTPAILPYPGQKFAVGSHPPSAAVADLNGDGCSDLIIVNNGSNDVSVLLGIGNGLFQVQRRFAAGSGPRAVAVADLNGDHQPDLVIANESSNDVSVLLGHGDGTFQAPQRFAAGLTPISVAVADLNGDGQPDLITANTFPNDVSVLLQQ